MSQVHNPVHFPADHASARNRRGNVPGVDVSEKTGQRGQPEQNECASQHCVAVDPQCYEIGVASLASSIHMILTLTAGP